MLNYFEKDKNNNLKQSITSYSILIQLNFCNEDLQKYLNC